MKTYKLSELKEKTLYKCLLSNRPVLVVNVNTLRGVTSIFAQAYNPVTGYIDSVPLYDNQLTDI